MFQFRQSFPRFRAARVALAAVLLLPLSLGLAPAHADIIHDYDLNGSFADNLGGPALVPNGGTLNATNYSFAPNQGLSLTNALPNTAVYSILTDFSFTTTSGFRKIIDFKNLSSDNGLYNRDQKLVFFNSLGSTESSTLDFAPNVLARLVITRDAANQFTGYVDGVQRISFTDTNSLAVFNPNIIQFFRDDTVTSGREASDGLVDKITIFDNALSSAEVLALAGPGTPVGVAAVPEPGTMTLMGLGLASLIGAGRRKKKLQQQSSEDA